MTSRHKTGRRESSCQLQMLALCWSEWVFSIDERHFSVTFTYLKQNLTNLRFSGKWVVTIIWMTHIMVLCETVQIIQHESWWSLPAFQKSYSSLSKIENCILLRNLVQMLFLLGSNDQKIKLDETPEILSFYLHETWTQCLFLFQILHAAFMVAQSFFY